MVSGAIDRYWFSFLPGLAYRENMRRNRRDLLEPVDHWGSEPVSAGWRPGAEPMSRVKLRGLPR